MPYADPAKRKEMHRKWASKNKDLIARYAKEWRTLNPEKVKAQQERFKARTLSARPIHSPCSSCGSSNLRWRNKSWQCLDCHNRAVKQRKKERNRLDVIAKRSKAIELKYGPRAAEAFSKDATKHPGKPARGPFAIHNLCLPKPYRRLGENRRYRIYQMNSILLLPAGNIGWTCQKCGIYSSEDRFFDIDHIRPRKNGGPGTRSNLQVLCPNCHRRKTCLDVWESATALSELPSAASRITPCATVQTIPSPEQNATATAQRPVATPEPPMTLACTTSRPTPIGHAATAWP